MFKVTTKNDGNEYTIMLDGRLDTNAAPEADRVFSETAAKADKVVVDCTDLEFLTSAGLRTFKRLRDSMKEKNDSLVSVINVRPEIMEIFEYTGFTAMLDFG